MSAEEINIHEDYDLQRSGLSTSQMLNGILRELDILNWIDASGIVRRDGILLASTMPTNLDVKNACAIMTATIVGAAKNITMKCKKGFPKKIIIQAREGDIVISEAGEKALLVCLTNTRYDPNVMFDEIERTAQRIDEIL